MAEVQKLAVTASDPDSSGGPRSQLSNEGAARDSAGNRGTFTTAGSNSGNRPSDDGVTATSEGLKKSLEDVPEVVPEE